jgi:hypothetical protein
MDSYEFVGMKKKNFLMVHLKKKIFFKRTRQPVQGSMHCMPAASSCIYSWNRLDPAVTRRCCLVTKFRKQLARRHQVGNICSFWEQTRTSSTSLPPAGLPLLTQKASDKSGEVIVLITAVRGWVCFV